MFWCIITVAVPSMIAAATTPATPAANPIADAVAPTARACWLCMRGAT
jgi:hypothetical protein